MIITPFDEYFKEFPYIIEFNNNIYFTCSFCKKVTTLTLVGDLKNRTTYNLARRYVKEFCSNNCVNLWILSNE